MPQNPPEDSEWLDCFPNEETRNKLTHSLGNLALLPRRINSRAQNYNFQRKKREYFSRNDRTSPFVLTTQVLSHEMWTPEIVEERQADLLDTLRKVWRL